MSLPSVIEIVPLSSPVRAAITVPGSKSITNRALILAALSERETSLEGALWSDDTQVMVEALGVLGISIEVEADPLEFGNRILTIKGGNGSLKPGGTRQNPLEIFVGNAGTAARFLAPLVCLGQGFYRLHGVDRMHQRPQGALFAALRELGYAVEAENERLPALIHGQGPKAGSCRVSIEQSSQFASGLLLCAETGGWKVEVFGENADESPYVAMTSRLIQAFPESGGQFVIEPDASSGSYFWAANELPMKTETWEDLAVSVRHWPSTEWQVDGRFPKFFASVLGQSAAASTVSRRDDLGDSIMTLIALAPFASTPVRFTDLGRLRVQECERVAALRTELTHCGAKVVEEGNTLTVSPGKLHGADISTYDDHRMAMCFAVVGLKVPGIRIKEPACVKKTFPNFFQKLAAPAPEGLGARILDGSTRRDLALSELFAA
jgi:3-phosphoshikimate 1-carboxyvinyltransferase